MAIRRTGIDRRDNRGGSGGEFERADVALTSFAIAAADYVRLVGEAQPPDPNSDVLPVSRRHTRELRERLESVQFHDDGERRQAPTQ